MHKYHGGRALLNRVGHESTAAIVAEIRDSKDETPEGYGSGTKAWIAEPGYVLQLSDCTRSVCFDLNFTTPEARENNLFKVSKMIEILTAFERGLKIETKRYEKRLEAQRSATVDS